MGFLRRSLLYLYRHKIKVFLLFMLFFILCNALISTFTIHQAVLNLDRFIKHQFGSVLRLRLDWSKDDVVQHSPDDFIVEPGPMEQNSLLTTETISLIGQSTYVKNYDYSAAISLGSDSLKYRFPPDEHVDEFVNKDRQHFGFHVVGTQSPSVMMFEEGKATLLSGRLFTREEIDQGLSVALITKELAEHNNLTAGDSIVLVSHVADIPIVEEIEYSENIPVQVIGIYEYNEQKTAFKQIYGTIYDQGHNYNQLIMPNNFVLSERLKRWSEEEDILLPDVVFVLHSPDDVQAFIEESSSLLPPNYSFLSNSSVFSDIQAPIESSKKMASQILLFSVVSTILILTLIILLFLHDRKHELGIYISLGMSRPKIITQVVTEVGLIAVLAIFLSLFTGQTIANYISDSMVRNQVVASVDYAHNDEFWYKRDQMGLYRVDVAPQDVRDIYDLSFSRLNIVIFYLIATGIVITSTILPVLYIIRLSPKKILMSG